MAVSQPVPSDAGVPDPATARKVLLVCLQVADLLLDAGMSANDVVVVLLRITHAYRLGSVHIDLTYTAVTMSYYPQGYAAPLTILRVVQPGRPDYDKARRVDDLVHRITRGLPIDAAVRDFDDIWYSRRRHPWWVSMVGNAGVGVGATLLFTTSWQVVVVTFLLGCFVDRLVDRLDERRVPPLFSQAASALLITLVAVGASAAGRHGIPLVAGLDPTLVVVGGIVMLVAGMLVVGAVQDAIDQFYVTASARLLEVAMRTAGIVVGIVGALHLANVLGIGAHVSADPVALGPVPAQLLGAFVLSACWAIYGQAGWVAALLTGAVGVLGWVGYLATVATVGEVPANAVGALLVGFVSWLAVRRSSVPSFTLVQAGLLPLVPGLALYEGLLQLVGTQDTPGNTAAGEATLGLALGVALGIAGGATLGTYLGRPVVSQMRRIRDVTRARRS